MSRTGSSAAGRRRRRKLLAALALVVVTFLIPTDRAVAQPEDPPDFTACDGLEDHERGICINREDPTCSYAEGEDLRLCTESRCPRLPRSALFDRVCRGTMEYLGELAAPGIVVDCAEPPPLWDAVYGPIWSDNPVREMQEFLERIGISLPTTKIPEIRDPGGALQGYHSKWHTELVEHGQCYLRDRYPRICDEGDDAVESPEEDVGPQQEAGFMPDPCVAEFRSSQYDINYSVGGFVNPEDRLFGSLSNLFFGLGKGVLQLAFVASDYAVDFDLVDRLGRAVDRARAAYQTQVAGPFDLNDIAWLLLVAYVAILVVVGKVAMAGAELAVSVLMLLLFTAVMQGPGGPAGFMRGASDTVNTASAAALRAGCQDGASQGSTPAQPGDRARRCEQEVLRDIQGDLHTFFIHDPYTYINWNWSSDFERHCTDEMKFILSTGPHGTEDWVRNYMRRSNSDTGPCAEAAVWNADATPERMAQALLAGSLAAAVAVVLAAMALTVILAKLVIAMLFVVAPLVFALAVLPGQGRRLAGSWWTTLAQAIVVAIGMCIILTLMIIGLRALVEIPADADLSLLERWFIIFALVVMIWYARKRLLTTARLVAASVSQRVAQPGVPGGFGGGSGLTDPRAGSIFGATRMSAAEGLSLAAQATTAAATTTALAMKPLGITGRSISAVYNRRANQKRSMQNLLRMDVIRRQRDAAEKGQGGALAAGIAAGGGGGSSGTGGIPGPWRGPGGGGTGGGPSRPPGGGRGRPRGGPGPSRGGGPSGRPRSGRPVPGPSDSGQRSPGGLIIPGGVAKPEPRVRPERRSSDGTGGQRQGGFWRGRWERRQELDAARRPVRQPRGWIVQRTSGWVQDRYDGARRWVGNRYDRMQGRWERRQAGRPDNRRQGWWAARRDDLHDVNLRHERMRRDALDRPTRAERREGMRETRASQRQARRELRDRWEPATGPEARDRVRRVLDRTRPARDQPNRQPDPGHVRGAAGTGRVWPPSRARPVPPRRPDPGQRAGGGASPGGEPPGGGSPEGGSPEGGSPEGGEPPAGEGGSSRPKPEPAGHGRSTSPAGSARSSDPPHIGPSERSLTAREIGHVEAGWDHGQGANVVIKLVFADRTSGIYKPSSGDNPKSVMRFGRGGMACREVAASRLNEVLEFGLVPTTTFWDGAEGRGSLQAFVQGARPGKQDLAGYTLRERERMAVFDYVIGNIDRHEGNYLTGADGRLIAIDHGASFPLNTERRIRSSFVADLYRHPLSDEMRGVLRSVDVGHLRKVLRGAGLQPEAIEGALSRLAELQTHGQITGEAWGGGIAYANYVYVQGGPQ